MVKDYGSLLESHLDVKVKACLQEDTIQLSKTDLESLYVNNQVKNITHNIPSPYIDTENSKRQINFFMS